MSESPKVADVSPALHRRTTADQDALGELAQSSWCGHSSRFRKCVMKMYTPKNNGAVPDRSGFTINE